MPGRSPKLMLALFLFATPFIVFRHPESAGDLDVWVFAQTHYNDYLSRVGKFEKLHPGVHVRLQLIQTSVLRDKLEASFLSNTAAPDIAEIEIGDVGRFFAGRASDIGFLDITDRLRREGWTEKIVASRFTPWTYRGRIYGVPHDIHPVSLLYRDDLLKKCGIDLPKQVQTWDQLMAVLSRPGVLDSRRDGVRDRYGIMFIGTDASHFRLLLLQRGQDLFDGTGTPVFDSPLAVDTLTRFSSWFKKDHLVFLQPADWGPDMYGPMKEDRLMATPAPDWFVGMIRTFAPEVAGKWRAMPLPAWSAGDRRTSTFGGTMTAITRQCKQPDLAFELVKFLTLDRTALINRYKTTTILPPLKSVWDAPIFHQPDPYFGNQRFAELLMNLAVSVPPVHQGKYFAEARMLLDPVVYAATTGSTDIPTSLHKAAAGIRSREAHDRFAN